MTRRFRTAVLPIAAALTLAAAGCADGGQDNGSANHAASHTDGADNAAAVNTAQNNAAEPADLPEAEPASPYTLDADVEERSDGYYVLVSTNLKLSSENYGKSPVEGEGHVHLYVNGGLVGPIQSEEPKQLTNLKEGVNKIRLVLAQNNHSLYSGVPAKELEVEYVPSAEP